MVEIREGKFYRTRGGRIVGPMEKGEQYGCGGPWLWKADGFYFMAKGYSCRGNNGSDHNPQEDLIAEWSDSPTLTEGPVRTVTRTVTEKTIEPGTYGIVSVRRDPHPNIAIVRGVHTADQLRAAAAVLLELAGALDSE